MHPETREHQKMMQNYHVNKTLKAYFNSSIGSMCTYRRSRTLSKLAHGSTLKNYIKSDLGVKIFLTVRYDAKSGFQLYKNKGLGLTLMKLGVHILAAPPPHKKIQQFKMVISNDFISATNKGSSTRSQISILWILFVAL